MDSIKSSFFFLTFIFLVTHIKCEDDIHLELSQKFISERCHFDDNYNEKCDNVDQPWLISYFLPQLNNTADSDCSESDWKSQYVSSVLSNVTTKWSVGDVDTLSKLQSKLGENWPTFSDCITKIEELNTVPKYFTKSFELYNKYNMKDILQRGNITVGNTYTYQEISDVVSKGIGGKKPIIKCIWDSRNTNKLELDKITIFFDKSFNLIDPIKNYYPGKCPSDLPIIFKNQSIKALDYSFIDRVIYKNPFDKYPTLRKDENGYYRLEQENKPAECPEGNLTRCHEPKLSWIIDTFTYNFKNDIDFTCRGHNNNPHNIKQFNITALSSIQSEIIDKWGIGQMRGGFPSVENALHYYWDIKGQCSTYFKGLDNEFKFYKKSLELFDKYNMDVILRQSNIVPGKNYTYQEISDAVSKAIDGKEALLFCIPPGFSDPNSNFLRGVSIYMDKYFNPVDPPDVRSRYINHRCNPNTTILYRDVKDYVDIERRHESFSGTVY